MYVNCGWEGPRKRAIYNWIRGYRWERKDYQGIMDGGGRGIHNFR